jgi:hypothetical protein
MARNYNILKKALICLSLVFWAVLSAHSQSIYRPIVVDNDTVGFVITANNVKRRVLFESVSPSVKKKVEESNAGVNFETATPELLSKAYTSWDNQRKAEIRKEQSKIERQMLMDSYVEMPYASDPVARALYNSGRYSQYAMTVSLTGGVLASLAAAENPPVSLAITLLTAATSIALNWKAGDELKKAGVYSRNK